VQRGLKSNFLEYKGKRNTKVEAHAPTKRIDNALTELMLISDQDYSDDDFLSNTLVQNQVKSISKIIEKIKRNMGL
jgi:hypothetical protein